MTAKCSRKVYFILYFTDLCSCSSLFDDLELCGLLGGTCRPQSSSCRRELRHRWGVALCGRNTDNKCCADRTVSNEGEFIVNLHHINNK